MFEEFFKLLKSVYTLTEPYHFNCPADEPVFNTWNRENFHNSTLIAEDHIQVKNVFSEFGNASVNILTDPFTKLLFLG